MTPHPPLEGSCLCGAVRFEADLPLRWFQYCHCTSCRKTTSSAHAAHLFFPPAQFRWVSGEETIQRFIDKEDNPGYKRFFCRTCGSSVPRLNRTEEWMVRLACWMAGHRCARSGTFSGATERRGSPRWMRCLSFRKAEIQRWWKTMPHGRSWSARNGRKWKRCGCWRAIPRTRNPDPGAAKWLMKYLEETHLP